MTLQPKKRRIRNPEPEDFPLPSLPAIERMLTIFYRFETEDYVKEKVYFNGGAPTGVTVKTEEVHPASHDFFELMNYDGWILTGWDYFPWRNEHEKEFREINWIKKLTLKDIQKWFTYYSRELYHQGQAHSVSGLITEDIKNSALITLLGRIDELYSKMPSDDKRSKSIQKDKARRIICEARSFLLNFDGIDADRLSSHLYVFKKPFELKSLSDVYQALLESAKSRRHFKNVIGDLSHLSSAASLYDFNPKEVLKNYENSYENALRGIAPRGIENDPKSTWVQFSKTVISAANFLSQFNDFEDFCSFVESFLENPSSRIGLPLLLEKEIHGFGFALACDFVKDNISPEFVKPDTHIKDIFKALNISRQEASDYEVFKDVVEFSEIAGELPYVVDRLFGLIGSGNFYRSEINIGQNKKKFIERINQIRF